MRNAIAYMAQNGIAANLLMLLILLVGVLSFIRVPQEVNPEVSLDIIKVRTDYVGASPEEVEDGVVRRIEEGIESIEGIDRISSVAAENLGVVSARLRRGADATTVLNNIKTAVDRITTFPEEAEQPQVQEVTSQRQAVQLAVHGNASEKDLKELANRIKDDLTAQGLVSLVRINGVRDYEISIEVADATLRAFGLSLLDVAAAVRRGSLDLPGGSVETRGEEILIRSKGQNYTAREFEDIIVLARPDGTSLRLRDIAQVIDGFEDADLITRFNGNPAAMVAIYRTSDERVLEIVEAVEEYVAEFRDTLPEGVAVDLWQNEATILDGRLRLMLGNGAVGLLLVLLTLVLFMEIRLALWTALGLFLSFVGAFAVMSFFDVSVNLLSLFAFILAIGIVVDDAIVIGESIFAEHERGGPPLQNAIRGVTRLARPVIFAVLTTIVAFIPILFIPGVVGKLLRDIPIIVIAVLVFSLIESLLILPSHLAHIRLDGQHTPGFVRTVQKAVASALARFTRGPLDRALRFCVRRYGLVIVSSIALIILSIGVVASGIVGFSFLPDVEGSRVTALIEMPQGVSTERTRQVAALVEERGRTAAAELQAELPDDHPPLITNAFYTVGEQPSLLDSPEGVENAGVIQSHIAEVSFEMADADRRELPLTTFEQAWREKTGTVAAAKSIVFRSSLFSLGSSIQAELSAPTATGLQEATARFKEEISRYAGAFDVQDDRAPGKREIQLSLLEQAHTLGVTLEDMARQVRAAFYGVEALRLQRGRDDIRVMVRLPDTERDALADVQNFHIQTPSGDGVYLAYVAEARLAFGPSAIQRRDRQRVTTVTANIDENVAGSDAVIAHLEKEVIPVMQREYPGLRVRFTGEQQEQQEALGALAGGFIIVLFVMYALLAIPFRSYTQPFIIMATIPFGFIGAVIGHLVMGISIGMLSLFGIVGLSGVIINDALVLIDFINTRRRAGVPMAEAILEGGKARFRPIMLTSITTFFGVTPLILERSLQAQLVVPMAVSLGFGILFATVILMMLVPALTMLHATVEQRLHKAL